MSPVLTLYQVALWTLGQLVQSTGYVVEPYKRYPHLLEVLLNFLKTEQALSIRREVRYHTDAVRNIRQAELMNWFIDLTWISGKFTNTEVLLY